jgi:uncharacterized membrane protein YfhO
LENKPNTNPNEKPNEVSKEKPNEISTSAPSSKPKTKPNTKIKPNKKPKLNFKNAIPNTKNWFKKPYNIYGIIAFFIPIIIVYVAMAVFGYYPFGEFGPLILDVNGQYVYYYQALWDAFHGDGSLFYNWSRSLSGEFMGNIGYYLASPFSLIVVILPKQMILESIIIMELAKIGTAGVAFYIFSTKVVKLKPLHAIILSTCYAASGYMVVQTVLDQMWIDGLFLLPFIIMGLQNLIEENKKVGYIVPLALLFFSNFYIGFMIAIFTTLYYIYYMAFVTNKVVVYKKFGDRFTEFFFISMRFAICSLISVAISAVMLLPVYFALKLGKFDFTEPDFSFKTQFELFDFVKWLMPDVYDTVRPEGSAILYSGVLSIVLLPLFYLNSKIPVRIKIGLTALIAVLFFSMYIKPIDMIWHGGQVPNWLPYRYSFLFTFVVLYMGAYVLKNLDALKISHMGGAFTVFLVFCGYLEHRKLENVDLFSSIWLAAGCFGAYCLFLYAMKNVPSSKFIPIVLLIAVSAELYSNANNTLESMNKDVVYSKHYTYYDAMNHQNEVVDKITEYDKENGGDGIFRSEKTFQRTLNDNMGLGHKGISHSSSVMNAKNLNFLRSVGYNATIFMSKYVGQTPITDSLIGIKYVVDNTNSPAELGYRTNDKIYNPLFSYRYYNAVHDSQRPPAPLEWVMANETEMKSIEKFNKKTWETRVKETNDEVAVFENPYALKFGYAASESALNIPSLKEHSGDVFENQNLLLSSLAGKNSLVTTDPANPIHEEYFTKLTASEPSLNNVTKVGERQYNKGTGDSFIEWRLTATSDNPVYCYFRTEYQKEVNLWVGSTQDEYGNFVDGTFDMVGYYFEGHNYGIMQLGNFKAGQEFAVRMTVKNDYTMFDEAYFYQLDMTKVATDLTALKEKEWKIEKFSDTKIKATFTVAPGEILMTSIPYEPGWTVKIDGKMAETAAVFDTFIGVKNLTPGEHTITMSFIPKGFLVGLLLCLFGIAVTVMFAIKERKHTAKKELQPSVDATV